MGSKILTVFQIVELQSPSLSAHLTVGVKGGSSVGSTLLHDDGLNTSLTLPGDTISTLIFFWGVCQEHASFWIPHVCLQPWFPLHLQEKHRRAEVCDHAENTT